MRTVFDNHMVVHVWAQQNQDEGRNAKNSLHFNGPTLYSYNEPIARFIVGADGRKAVVHTSARWSITTSAHQSAARSAASQYPHYSVPCVTWSPERNRQAMAEQRDNMIKEISEGRTKVSRAKRYEQASSYVNSCNLYLNFVGLEHLPPMPADLDAVKAEAERIEAARQAVRERQREEYQRREREEKEKALASLSEWFTDNNRYPEMSYRLESSYMKILNGEVVTSHGATVPIEHVRRAAPVVLAIIREGRTYRANGHTIHLGHFSLDSIDENGTVRAGCHTFLKEEIERFAKVLDAYVPAEETASV